MANLFTDYNLVASSGLFDGEYYRTANPEILARNQDPLTHYLEEGARARRAPSSKFDTAYYLRQCKSLGERPDNPLLHYLTVGRARGLLPHKSAVGGARHEGGAASPSPVSPPTLMNIDVPSIQSGVADVPVTGGLAIAGWGLTARGVSAIDIAVDGQKVSTARYGIRRPDVAAVHSEWEGALLSGFAAHIPSKAMVVGHRRITVTLRDATGPVAQTEFLVTVQDLSDATGPCALRRKMNHTEVTFKHRTLERRGFAPVFEFFLALDDCRQDPLGARRTIDSLTRQTYGRWRLTVAPGSATGSRGKGTSSLIAELGRGFERFKDRIVWGAAPKPTAAARRSGSVNETFHGYLSPGDDMGCDALLEYALAGAANPDADMLFCDERTVNPATGRTEAYFKPGWSPDLLLSSNYLGRAWVVNSRLASRAGVSWGGSRKEGGYALTLKLTEAATGIVHVPKLLFQRGILGADTQSQQRQALLGALKRRSIPATVLPGLVEDHFRIKRKAPSVRVSIIIPTCGARGLIKTCIESIRRLTDYANVEIVCIENIPNAESRWKRWVRQHADVVIETHEPFNWSRFNNLAAEQASGEYLLFLNDDIEIVDAGWLSALVEQVRRPEVGVVGALLLYPDRTVQQAGVMLDAEGRGLHAFRHLAEGDPGYFGLALTQRNVISVTGACLMTRRETFRALAGFDESHSVINNDLDFCLRAWESGLLNVYTPFARLIHHEAASRASLDEHYDIAKFQGRWRGLVAAGDPYFNRNLSRDQEQFTVEREPLETVYADNPLYAREDVRRILVLKLDHIGDCITALPALRRLKRHFPKASISVMAARGTRSVWAAEPIVDEFIEYNLYNARSGLGKLEVSVADQRRMEESLHARRFDLAVDLRKQPDSREALRLSGARLLAGFDSHGRFPWLDIALEWDEDTPLRTKRGHVSNDLLSLVEAIAIRGDDNGVGMTPVKKTLKLPKSEQQALFSKPLVCIHPAAGSPMRQWAAERFAELIKRLLEWGPLHIAVIGGPDEAALTKEVLAQFQSEPRVFNLVGRLSLDELPTLLERSALFVGNNSGPHHMAAALGTPTVGIHSGVVDAREWSPLGAQAVAIRRDVSCSPCFIEKSKDCPRALACLTGVTVTAVLKGCVEVAANLSLRSRDFASLDHTWRPGVAIRDEEPKKQQL